MTKKTFVDARKLNLEEWLKHVLVSPANRDYSIMDYQFPTDEHLNEYLESIGSRSESEVRVLVESFLIEGGHLGIDTVSRHSLLEMSEPERHEKFKQHSYFKRLMDLSSGSQPWQGITWVTDLLPHYPQEALNALTAYFIAHCQLLPDGRMQGISDAGVLIKAKYLEHELPVKDVLLNMTPSDFEMLVGYLYMKKGYEVVVTPRQRDGGFDVLATNESERQHEVVHVECKRYEENVGVGIIRNVLGTLIVRQATRAVIVTTADFTGPARAEAKRSKRLELVGLSEFDRDMRASVSPNWPKRIPEYLMTMKGALSK